MVSPALRREWARLMTLALDEGEKALPDVPIGAVVVDSSGEVIGRGHNERELTGDPTAHAEIVAMRAAAAALGTWRLDGCTLVVTVEPCTMCAGALVLARVSTVVFGAWEPKTIGAHMVVGVFRFSINNGQQLDIKAAPFEATVTVTE